jgi:hypothetical protein
MSVVAWITSFYGTSLPNFLLAVNFFWDLRHGRADAALTISAKFKALRGLKAGARKSLYSTR